jgi:hypothetical protein
MDESKEKKLQKAINKMLGKVICDHAHECKIDERSPAL